MNLKLVQELWIFSNKGGEIVHLQKMEQEEKSGLIQNFLNGIHKFMQDMGGGEFYHFSISGKEFIGISIALNIQKTENSFFLIGKFGTNHQKRCLKHLNKIKKLILSAKMLETSLNNFPLILKDKILEQKLF